MTISPRPDPASQAESMRHPAWCSRLLLTWQKQLRRGLIQLMWVIFALLAYGQASAACNLSFSTTVGGQVTKSGNEYKYTFSATDYANCDPGGKTDGTGSSLGIYVDAIGNQNSAGNKTFSSSSAHGSNNVYIMSIGGPTGPTNIDAFYYTPPNGYSGPDSFVFYDFNGSPYTVNVTVTAPVPGSPTGITATAGDTQASVAFTAPASDGGSAILDYTVTSSPGGLTKTGAASPLVVTGLTNGTAYTFTVKARNANGSSVASTASSAVTPKATQTITFSDPGPQNFGTTPTLSATASSSLTPTFTSSTTGVCTITSGGALTFVTVGTCTINADQAGNTTYSAATTVPQTFAVNAVVPGAPTAAAGTAGTGQVSVVFTAPASDGGSAILDYTVTSSPGGFTKTGATSPLVVTGLTNGTAYTFTVTARNSVGSGSASTASSAVTPKATQTITFASPGPQNFGTTPTLSASVSSGLTPTFTSSTTGVCTITSGGALTFVTAGTCTINADQVGNGTYLAAPTVSSSFTVNAVVPGVPTGAAGTAGSGQTSVAFAAPASNGGSAIIDYTVTSSPGGFTATGTASPIVVTGLTNGTAYTFTVTARNSIGSSSASVASSAVTPTATQQTITFNDPGGQTFGTTPTLSASASSGLTPTFSSTTTGVCTITSGGALTFVTAGSCTINADQAGNGTYGAAATVSRTFTVSSVAPGVPTGVVGTPGAGQVSVAFTAPASNGGSAITGYTVTASPGGATVSGAASPLVVTGLTNGTAYTFTVIATNSAGPSVASAASSAVTPNVPQTITFASPSAQILGAALTVTATASSGLTVTFTSSTPAVCTVTSGGVVSSVSVGLCTINANQAGNTNFAVAPTVTHSFSINALPVGVLTFATPGSAQVSMGSSLANAATSTLSGGSFGGISYSSSDTAVATVSANGTITPVSVGSSTITATQAAVAGVNAQATQSYLLTVGKKTQATLSVVSDKSTITRITGTASLTITGGSGSGAVNTAVTAGSCSVVGNVVTAGSVVETCAIAVTKAADTEYSASIATVNIQVLNVATSSVTLASSSLNPVAGQSVNLTATVNPGAATGSARFMDGATLLAQVNISGGVANVSTSTLTVGSHNLTVVYSGDANTAGSTSAAIVVSVNSRPDPLSNPLVKQSIVSQVTTTQRFAVTQMTNIYNHVQILHSDFNVRNRFGAGLNMPYLDTFNLMGGQMLASLSGTPGKDVLAGEFGTPETAEYQRRVRTPFAQDAKAYQKEKRIAKDDEADQEPIISDDVSRIAGMPAAFWTAGNIDMGSLGGQQDGSRTKFSSAGLTLGMDVMINSKLIAGGSLGYAKDKATFDSLGSESKAQQWSGSLYATYKLGKQWFVDGILGAGQVTYDNRRWDSSNNVLLSGDRKGKIVYGSLSLTREMILQQFRVHPFGRVDVLNASLDSYSEQGSAMALTFKNSSFTSSTVTGGLDIYKDYFFAGGQLTPSLKLQLSHRTNGDVNQAVYYSDLGANGPTYNAVVTGIPEDVQSLGLGLNFKNRRGFQANFAWLGSMGANAYRANSFRVDLLIGF